MFKLWLKNLITFKLANADLYKNVAKLKDCMSHVWMSKVFLYLQANKQAGLRLITNGLWKG